MDDWVREKLCSWGFEKYNQHISCNLLHIICMDINIKLVYFNPHTGVKICIHMALLGIRVCYGTYTISGTFRIAVTAIQGLCSCTHIQFHSYNQNLAPASANIFQCIYLRQRSFKIYVNLMHLTRRGSYLRETNLTKTSDIVL